MAEQRRRLGVAPLEHARHLAGDREPAGAVALGPHDVKRRRAKVDVADSEPAGLARPQPARVHEAEEARRLPRPGRSVVELPRRLEEGVDFRLGQQIRGDPHHLRTELIGENVGVLASARPHEAAQLAYMGHPREMVGGSAGSPLLDVRLDACAVELCSTVVDAPPVEVVESPVPGAAFYAHAPLEREKRLDVGSEGAGVVISPHAITAFGSGSTHAAMFRSSASM